MVTPKRRSAAAPLPDPVPHDAHAPSAQVLRRFRLVFNAVKTHFRQVEKKAGIGGAQLWALSIIGSTPDIGVSGLAEAMDIHQTTTSNLVKTLTGLELIQAQRDGPDRRTVQLRLTPAGTRLLRRAPAPFAGVLPQALAELDAATLARLDHDLGLLIEKLHVDERGAGIPLSQM